MREIKIGDQTIRVRATPLALLFYRQEFKSDLIADLVKMQKVDEDPSKFDAMVILQMVWAMAKADAYGKEFPSFESWLAGLDGIDLYDQAFITAVFEEAVDGFFRSGAAEIKAKLKSATKQ